MTTTDLATVDTAVALRAAPTLADKMKYAEALAMSSLLPQAYQRQPANLLLAQ